jgi:HEAT repeat protein
MMRHERAVQPLIDALGDTSVQQRWVYASALGMIRDQRATEPLIDALTDGDSDVRVAAAKGLGEIGDPRAVDPLVSFLEAQVRPREFTFYVGGNGLDLTRSALETASRAVHMHGGSRAQGAREAVEALAKLGDRRAVPALQRASQDAIHEVRNAADAALKALGGI